MGSNPSTGAFRATFPPMDPRGLESQVDPEPVTRATIDLIGQMEVVCLMKTSLRFFALLVVLIFAVMPAMVGAMPMGEGESCQAPMQGDNVACHSMDKKRLADCAPMVGCAILRATALLTFARLDPLNARFSFDLSGNGAKSAFVPVDYPPPRA